MENWFFASIGFHHVTWESSAQLCLLKGTHIQKQPQMLFQTKLFQINVQFSDFKVYVADPEMRPISSYNLRELLPDHQESGEQKAFLSFFLSSIRSRIPQVFKWRRYVSVTSKNLITCCKKSLEESTDSNDKQTMGLWWSFCITWIKSFWQGQEEKQPGTCPASCCSMASTWPQLYKPSNAGQGLTGFA